MTQHTTNTPTNSNADPILGGEADDIRKAIFDGIANHTLEWANPWIFRENYTPEQLQDILLSITSNKRLLSNLQKVCAKRVEADRTNCLPKAKVIEAIGPELSTEGLTSQALIDARNSQNQVRRQIKRELGLEGETV